ncbi:MAG TPA: fused MFS/spermidine synthase [Bryobacteraceae bacterium]|nr:fused MFS/spermidine synthase [Bryobacteraceae bacterium]
MNHSETPAPALRRYFPLLAALFAASGCAALIYEIVWLQLLQLAIGSSAVSLGVLLGTYMGGMCLGSILFARVVRPGRHPLRVYAALELGIGIFGLLVLWAIPLVDRLYAALAVHILPGGFSGILLRAVAAAVCLIPPTLLMGASLPAVARWVEADAEGVASMGRLYGANIAGAIAGCLAAGFYLLRVFDMRTATYTAVAVNFAVAVAAWALARRAGLAAHGAAPPVPQTAGFGAWSVYLTIGLSGMCALGAEVVWTRLLSLMLGATTYTFSIILAVLLLGMGLGSAAGARLKQFDARAALGWSQMLAAAAVAWAAFTLADSLPYWPVDPLLSTNPWFNFQIDLMRCLWVVFPASWLWGASFTLALKAAARPEQDPSRLAGGIYAANTVGAIAGALGFSLIFIPWLGTRGAQQVLIGLSALAGIVMLAPLGKTAAGWPARKVAFRIAEIAVAAFAAVLLAQTAAEIPWVALAYGRRTITTTAPGKLLYRGEGMNSSVVVSQLDSGQVYFHVSGKVEASTEPFDMRLQRMLGHLPALVHPGPRSVLIVGFGAGVTAGAFVVHPEMQHIVICEIEPLIPPASTRYFAKENHNVLHDPRTHIIYDDARHFILTTPEKFDIITSDPIHPWVKGTATLYSKEYFEIVKSHLNPGGVVTQWVPLYESDPETVQSELATFFDVFPNGTVWANNNNGQGYDVVLLGQAGETHIDVDQLDARLNRPDHARVLQSLQEAGLQNAIDLLANYYGSAKDLRPWLNGAAINQDMSLRLQYLAGMGVNFNNAPLIGSDIRHFRRFPHDLFTGSQERLSQLRVAIEQR